MRTLVDALIKVGTFSFSDATQPAEFAQVHSTPKQGGPSLLDQRPNFQNKGRPGLE
jgi:hypothetical protein